MFPPKSQICRYLAICKSSGSISQPRASTTKVTLFCLCCSSSLLYCGVAGQRSLFDRHKHAGASVRRPTQLERNHRSYSGPRGQINDFPADPASLFDNTEDSVPGKKKKRLQLRDAIVTKLFHRRPRLRTVLCAGHAQSHQLPRTEEGCRKHPNHHQPHQPTGVRLRQQKQYNKRRTRCLVFQGLPLCTLLR